MVPETGGTTTGVTVAYNCQAIVRLEVDYWDAAGYHKCKIDVAPPAPLPIKLSSFNGRLTTDNEATIAWSSSPGRKQL